MINTVLHSIKNPDKRSVYLRAHITLFINEHSVIFFNNAFYVKPSQARLLTLVNLIVTMCNILHLALCIVLSPSSSNPSSSMLSSATEA